jgi:hypothetical protein
VADTLMVVVLQLIAMLEEHEHFFYFTFMAHLISCDGNVAKVRTKYKESDLTEFRYKQGD